MCVTVAQFVIEILVSAVSHHALWQCPALAPTDLYIDTGSAAQSLNPDSVQKGIRGIERHKGTVQMPI